MSATPLRRRRATARAIGSLAAVALASPLASQQEIHHRFDWKPGETRATITTEFPTGGHDRLWIALPGWIPGRFRVEDLGRGLDMPTASSGERQLVVIRNPLAAGWVVGCQGADRILVRHEIDLDPRGARHPLGTPRPRPYDLEGERRFVSYHAAYLLQGAATWLFAPQTTAAAQRVTWALPPGFEVTVAAAPGSDGSYTFPDYATLARSPVHVGTTEHHPRSIGGIPHRIALSGFEHDRADRDQLLDAIERVFGAQIEALGGAPYRSHTVLIGRQTVAIDGVGHPTSLALWSPGLAPTANLLRSLAECHLQAWTSTRLRPAAWAAAPLALARPPSSPHLWFQLGAPLYCATMNVLRSGCGDAAAFWSAELSRRANLVMRRRAEQTSVASAGERAFTGGADHDPSAPGHDLQECGFLIALLLDVEIRAATRGAQRFEDVLRRLLKADAGYADDGIRLACEQVSGLDLRGFFAAHVRGTEPLPLTATLAKIGLAAAPSRADPPQSIPGRPPTPRRHARWTVQVDPGAPARAVQLREQMTEVAQPTTGEPK